MKGAKTATERSLKWSG